ncbi:MAG: hypothetical protein RLZZ609_393 [Cyanobacteriota bacterium]|jgi:hypothetical protein
MGLGQRRGVRGSHGADEALGVMTMREGPMRVVNVHQAQRIPGRLRSRGPLSQPNVLLEPMDPSDLGSWERGPLLPEAPQP